MKRRRANFETLATRLRDRIAEHLGHEQTSNLLACLHDMATRRMSPPRRGRGYCWRKLAALAAVDERLIKGSKSALLPLLDCLSAGVDKITSSPTSPSAHALRLSRIRKRGVSDVYPLPDVWQDHDTFSAALDLHMRRFSETAQDLWCAIIKPGEAFEPSTIVTWQRGRKSPRSIESFVYLARIERRYGLPEHYFRSKLAHRGRATTRLRFTAASPSERRRLAWHIPDDFADRSPGEQAEILDWVRRTIVSGATDFRRFQANAIKQRYGLRFRTVSDRRRSNLDAPQQLNDEIEQLVAFKTRTLTSPGYSRRGVWCGETASQKREHLGLLFGALTADPLGPVRGYGARRESLSVGLLVFPAVWDWYVRWREQRRGFYTVWEVDMFNVAVALTASETGWITQTPSIAKNLRSIEGLVSTDDIAAAQRDWRAACATLHAYALKRAKEIQRVARVHRDPFEPILPVLEAESPLAEYRKIADEIARYMPDAGLYPKEAAETLRSLLLIRLGLHLGLRQKNLRQLILVKRGATPSSEQQLSNMQRGELRWSERDNGWEVFIPAAAFKNAHSSFFKGRPFRLLLPDLCDLYRHIGNYIETARPLLLSDAVDPGTFFVKTVKRSSESAAYNQATFYEAWRLITQRYGVYNPYTGRGAIPGLLPHGPHNVRDVLATHVLKQTGSFEQASYAIQDTPDIVARHYGRFLPGDKAAMAAAILNRVWQS